MEVVLRSYFGAGSGLVDDEYSGLEKSCFVTHSSDVAGILGFLMSAVSECSDIRVEFFPLDD